MPDRKRGQQIFGDVTCFEGRFDPPDDFTGLTVDFVFGDVWARPGLTRKERRLLSIASTITAGMADEAEVHLRGALQSGDVTPAEMMEVVIQLAVYSGWPKGASMYRLLARVCADLGLEVPRSEAG